MTEQPVTPEAGASEPILTAYDPLNKFAGDFSEEFIKALRSGHTAQCLALLEGGQVRVMDDGAILHWMAEREILTANEENYQLIIQSLKADIIALEQPLDALRPALLGAITYFEDDAANPKAEDSKWRMGRKFLKGVTKMGMSKFAGKVTAKEKDAQHKLADHMIDGVIALVKFGINNKDVLEATLKGVQLVPAYEVIQKHQLITQPEIDRIQIFVESKIKAIAPPTDPKTPS